MTHDNRKVSESDAREMIRLLGETASLEGAQNEKKRFLMNGLCRIIEADAWAWTLGIRIRPGAPQTYAGILHEGFDEIRFTHFLTAVEHPVMSKVVAPFFQSLRQGHTNTMTREEIDPEGLALADGVRQCWEMADIGPVMMSGHLLDEQCLSSLGIYRKPSGRPFSNREKQITQIILTEVPWLHATGWPEDRGVKVPELAPRQRIVLNLMLDGLDRKSIAANMRISENTVSSYAKEVYRHFGVQSQPQLMRKFLSEADF